MVNSFGYSLICIRELNIVSHSMGLKSSFFSSLGVRQGKKLSPVIFALFIDDLGDVMKARSCFGIILELVSDDLYFYLKLLALLYADGTGIFGTDETSFEKNLDIVYEYVKMWKLDINYDKTKILIFGTRNDDRFSFNMGESKISICKRFKYLGVFFSLNAEVSVKPEIINLIKPKRLYLLYKIIRKNLSIDLQLQLFEHTILSIALYVCEIRALENTNFIEKPKVYIYHKLKEIFSSIYATCRTRLQGCRQ